MDRLIQKLVHLGLNDKEARIYLALFRLGEATSYEVAKESGIKRPTVYVIMEELRKKGLALVVPHAKKQVFIAKDPREYISEYQSRVSRDAQEVFSLIPKLSSPERGIRVFKGPGALEQGLSYGLHSTKEKDIIALYAGVYPNTKIGSEYSEHFEELERLGFMLRSIVPDNSRDESFREWDRKAGFETRKIDHKAFSPKVSIEVMGSIVKTIFHKNKEVMVVDDAHLADLYRQMFEILWSKSHE
jgi:HTH-type transcriptional regulator, sugar sensing transcriptional regulator